MRAFGQDRRPVFPSVSIQPFGNHDEVGGGVGLALSCNACIATETTRRGFAGLLKLPAGDGRPSHRLQVLEVYRGTLPTVYRLFSAEGEGTPPRWKPRINQRHLHHVKLLFGIAYKRSDVGDVDVHLGLIVKDGRCSSRRRPRMRCVGMMG